MTSPNSDNPLKWAPLVCLVAVPQDAAQGTVTLAVDPAGIDPPRHVRTGFQG